MKTVKSLADLHRMALSTGAEVVTPEGRFNSSRAQVATLRQSKPVEPVHSPPTLATAVPASIAPVSPPIVPQPVEWSFQIDYDADGAITNVKVKATS